LDIQLSPCLHLPAWGIGVSVMLGIETSTDACSVAVAAGGEVLEDHRVVPRQHNALVLQCVESLLASAGVTIADVELLAFGRGPGSFTGLRIAASVVQGLALARSLPVVGVSTLELLAAGVALEDPGVEGCACVLPARPGEAYVGLYGFEDGRTRAVSHDELVAVRDFVCPPDVSAAWCVVGDANCGRQLGLGALRSWDDPHPHAAVLLALAERAWRAGAAVDAAAALPVYLQPELPWRKADA
jgi:tRNA threonylcarbamoyladenosine biosynthesis protein TsaB